MGWQIVSPGANSVSTTVRHTEKSRFCVEQQQRSIPKYVLHTFSGRLPEVHVMDDGTPSCLCRTPAAQIFPLFDCVDGVLSHFGNGEGGTVRTFVYVSVDQGKERGFGDVWPSGEAKMKL